MTTTTQTAKHLPATDSAPAQTEAFEWNPDGQLLGAENTTLGIRIERHYNTLGQLSLEAQYLGDHWSWQASHQYDARGRREQSQLGDIPPIDWLSYGPGHLLGISSGPLSIHFARNALHQETQRELYTRDEGDNRQVHKQQRQYDALGRLEHSQLKPSPDSPSALHWERRYQYDSQDQLQQLQDNRHGRIGYQYDDSGRLTGSLHQQSEQSKQTQTYRFDAAGNRLDHGPQAGAKPEDWAATVAANLHNPDFNLLGEGKSQPAPTAACWPDNRILSHEGEQYHYDRIGNLIERLSPDGSRLQLGYDGANRLIRLERTKANGERWTADYGYDPLGRRLCKQVEYTDTSGQTQPTQITCYGWDGGQQSAEARLSQGGEWQMRTTLYEPGSFVPLLRIGQDKTNNDPMLLQVKRQLASAGEPMPEALRQALAEEASEPRYASYHTDHLGTPLALTDEQGQLLWEARPDDWAAIKDEQGKTDQPIRFQGQYEDEESGLYYNRHRYYDPALGRYVNQDPIGLLGGVNFYLYAAASPTNHIDPSGLIIPLAWGAFAFGSATLVAVGNWGRNVFNEPYPGANTLDADWIKMDPEQSVLHRQGDVNLSCGGSNPDKNRKFVSPSGHSEYVIDELDCLVTDTKNQGTYNYFSPYTLYGVPHVVTDVAPYMIFGTSPLDMFTKDRFKTSIDLVIDR
ncbi:RHS repeat-associated core domain-containing protein [Halopseudomonas salegens]|uniref:RHS repeat-associated core domain-containing protein n=1 Tax=Halopseudomonas salegens TaxID=1434072 RepID=A0A1H2EQS1_9GAMM|nr:RHS repeat-associated core domain-containing protein [Halopseudomonas salegens]SDT97470.1 RHS repeat-associated core domain-containing protein [Halopseudomonas salegens]